jgi:hypothetical protein
MYNKRQCETMPIEGLNIREPCLIALKESGFVTVDDLVDFLAQTWRGRAGTIGPSIDVLKCLDEIVKQLKAVSCWPDALEDNLR